MKVMRPYDVATATVLSNSAVEVHAEYSAGTTYALNAKCTMASTGRTYNCIQGPSTGNAPPSSPLYWMDVGPSNKRALFDGQISTQTTATDTLTVKVAAGAIDSVALVGVNAQSALVVVRDGPLGPIIFQQSISFAGDIPTDWYAYFFYDENTASTIGLCQNIPPYQSAVLEVTLSGVGAIAIGGLLFGLSYFIGNAQYGASAGIIDYSRKNTSATGVTTFEQKAYSKRLSVELMLDRAQMNRVQRTLYSLRATPCVWIGSDNAELVEATVVYGFYRDFSATIQYFTHSLYSLEIEGLI